ncbi:MAG: hypothetical protein IJE14_10135 [Clostridia bacterium]|nr:hypothetical protein [Clostridia bacterium]
MSNQDIPDIVKLIHDFNCTDPDEMYFSVLADRVRYFKETPEGQAEIFKMFDDARKEAADARAIKIARSLLNTTFSVEQIAEICALSVEEVQKIKGGEQSNE